MKKAILCVLLSGCIITSGFAQELKLPAPSPTSVVKQDFSTSSIEITYSRPAMRGRKIFGNLIPFGKVWRTGANSATKITFGEDISLSGRPLKAGTYALYTIPGKKSWTIIINKGVSNWGVSGFSEKDDVLKIDLPVRHLKDDVQSFTISIDNIEGNQCELSLSWESTKISIPVMADNEERITDYLEDAIHNPKRPYQQAANFYLETGKNLNKALLYTDQAIEENKDAFWLYWLKARIYQKMGKKAEAFTAADKAAELAASTPYAFEYQKNADDLKKQMK